MDFRRVVVGFDHSDEAIRAAGWAADQTGPGGEVRLVRVCGSHHEQDLDDLDEFAAGVASDRLVSTEVILSDDPAAAIAETASRFDAEAVVLGARHHQRWHPHRLSAVAAHLHHHSGLPLITVRPPEGDRRRICVGVDGTDQSWAGLRWVIEKASADDQIKVVWVVGDGIVGDVPTLPVKNMDILVRAIEAYLERQVDELVGELTVTISTEVRVGHAVEELLEAASDCGVLAVGYVQHRPLRRVLERSVSLQLLREYDRTMVVIA